MKRIVACLAAALVALGLLGHATLADETEPNAYVKGTFCLACHGVLNKDLVARYKETKHAKVEIKDDMQPVDIYRRSVGFNPADNTYLEGKVGCQDCHGPGQIHLRAKTEDKKATMEPFLPTNLKTPRQKLSVCGRCHGQYTVKGQPFVADFKPGMDIFALEGFKLAEVKGAGPFQQLNDLESSKHGQNDVTCITCHTAHEEMAAQPQLRKPVPQLCLDCHATKHPCKVDPEGKGDKGTCVTCHMPDGRHIFAVKP